MLVTVTTRRKVERRLAPVPMQGARATLALLALSTIAVLSCAARQPPSTAGHDDVAERPDDVAPEPVPGPIASGGNQGIHSFDEAKRTLLHIYEQHRIDLYCGCTFLPEPGHGLRVDLSACGYVVAREPTRAARIEWEHAVAAATFGRTFPEWTAGSERCVDKRGKRFKGRTCARTSPEFARMEGDLHNLFPVVGEVNALRGDLPLGILDPPERTPPHHRPTADVLTFGACKSTIERGVFQPRQEIRGDLARASLYMDRAYPSRHILDDAHRALFERWSAEDPPDDWERERNRRIAERQGNANPFIP